MASSSKPVPLDGLLGRIWRTLLILRPTFALAAVWLTTAGHTMNFREMDAARGWITTVGYSLHSIYLIAIALTLLVSPNLVPRFGSYRLVIFGLLLLLSGSAVNGVLPYAPIAVLELGRVLAGIGSGLVIQNAPRLHPRGGMIHVEWAGIILPAAGPVVIAAATYFYGFSSWEGAFLFEGLLAMGSLAMILSISKPLDPDPDPLESLSYLPPLAIGAFAVWYVMHWGQLQGWLESTDIFAAVLVAVLALNLVLLIVWRRLDWVVIRSDVPRLLLIAYGGFVQYFNASDVGVYGGLLINFSPIMRSWLICSLSIGATTALAVGRLVWSARSPGYSGATFGLLVLAGGMAISHHRTMNWPFWQVLNSVEFNWFAAPQHWQLAPSRFLMGFGSAMVLLSMSRYANPDEKKEAKVRPFLQVAQFLGGALAIGVLATYLLVGHQIHYSYTSDRGYIQSVEQEDRRQRLSDALATGGSPAPDRQAETLLYRGVNYEADNLIFAEIYSSFLVVSCVLAGLCASLRLVERRR